MDNTQKVIDALFPTKNNLGKSYLSYSFMSGFMECPARALNDAFEDSDPTVFGKWVHDLIEYSTLNPEIPAIELLDKCCELIDTGKAPRSGYSIRWKNQYREKAKTIFDDTSFFGRQFDGFELLSTESKNLPKGHTQNIYGKNYFVVEMPFQCKYILLGSIDKISANADMTCAIIQDWKTGKTKIPDAFQVMTYGYAAFSMWPTLRKINCWYDYVEFKDSKLVCLVRDEEQKADYVNKKYAGQPVTVYSYKECCDIITEHVKYYMTGISDPTPSESACRWCSFKDRCPVAYKD